MNLALISHDPASGRITVHELPTLAVIEPLVQDPDEAPRLTAIATVRACMIPGRGSLSNKERRR
jgi:hypothetical protein